MGKKKIAWITDSTAYIPEYLKDHPHVYSIPIGIIFDDEVYEDGVDLTNRELYDKIKHDKAIPKTSQPSIGSFAQLYEELKENYEGAIAIHVSSKLSGTLESSRGGKELAQFHVEVVDSFSISSAITILIDKGIDLANHGMELKEIASYLREAALRTENYILVGSLEQLYKGGRMNSAQYLIGSLLQIKPILQIAQTGELKVFEKVRSEKKALTKMINRLEDAHENHNINQVYIMHGNRVEKAKEVKRLILERLANFQVIIGDISSSIAVHAGEGTIGLVWHNE